MITESVAAIGAVKNAVDLVKSLDRNAKVADLKRAVNELLPALTEAQLKVYDLVNRVNELTNELAASKETLQYRRTFTFRDDVFWSTDAAGKEDGPFCPKCYQGSGKANYLQKMEGISGTDLGLSCSVCKYSKYKTGALIGGAPSVSRW